MSFVSKFTVNGINENINADANSYIEECENAYRKLLEKVSDRRVWYSGRKLGMLACA